MLFRIIDVSKVESTEIVSNKMKKKISDEVCLFFESFLKRIKKGSFDTIIVSNEVGMGIVPSFPLGRVFRDLMGTVNKMVASDSDEVYFFIAGLKQRLK